MRINLKRPSPTLATAAVLLASAAAAPVAFAALPPLASTASITHNAALGCSRAAVCTTATSTAGNATHAADHPFYPIGQENAVTNHSAQPAFVCYDACQRN